MRRRPVAARRARPERTTPGGRDPPAPGSARGQPASAADRIRAPDHAATPQSVESTSRHYCTQETLTSRGSAAFQARLLQLRRQGGTMPQQGTSGESPEQGYGETVAPQNPPNSVVRPAVRRRALVTVLGGIIVMFVIVAGAFVYFTASDEPGGSRNPTDPTAVGTSGERMPREGTPGGFDTDPSFGSTRDELKYRGDTTGRVELDDVQVERTEGDAFWVRSGNRSVAVIAPGGMPTVKAGQRVDITGTTESNGRIRATRI